jgi:hypothetical protein
MLVGIAFTNPGWALWKPPKKFTGRYSVECGGKRDIPPGLTVVSIVWT